MFLITFRNSNFEFACKFKFKFDNHIYLGILLIKNRNRPDSRHFFFVAKNDNLLCRENRTHLYDLLNVIFFFSSKWFSQKRKKKTTKSYGTNSNIHHYHLKLSRLSLVFRSIKQQFNKTIESGRENPPFNSENTKYVLEAYQRVSSLLFSRSSSFECAYSFTSATVFGSLWIIGL